MSNTNPETDNDPLKMSTDEPINFHHPYTPYDVQLDFMRTVYDVLEKGDGQVGIFESPTGTVSPSHPFPFSTSPSTSF